MDFNVEFALKAVENFVDRYPEKDAPYEVIILTYHNRGGDWEANLCCSKPGFTDRSFWVRYNAVEDTAELSVYKLELRVPIQI